MASLNVRRTVRYIQCIASSERGQYNLSCKAGLIAESALLDLEQDIDLCTETGKD